jgi:hypothetical protein
MSYNPPSDFVGLWRAVSGGVEKGEMPGLDFVVAALNRAGLLRVVTSATAPASNQIGTAWFRPANPSFSSEGALFLWDGSTYVPATPELFHGSGGSTDSGGGGNGGDGAVGTTTLVFAITQESQVAISTSAWGVVPLTATPQVDTMGGWDNATKKFTPKQAGYYAFNVRGSPNTGGTSGGIAIVKNDDGDLSNTGPDTVLGMVNSQIWTWQSVTCFGQMNGTTDFVRYWAYGAQGTMQSTGSSPAFSALLLP